MSLRRKCTVPLLDGIFCRQLIVLVHLWYSLTENPLLNYNLNDLSKDK